MKKSRQAVSESRMDVFFDTMLTELAEDPCAHKYARDRLIKRAKKKARYVRSQLKAKAVEDFISDNNRMAEFQLALDDDLVNNAKHFITVMLERFTTRNNVDLIQETLDYSFLFDCWRFGPGASYEVKGTHAADKIWKKMTCTDSCVPLVTKLRRTNPYFRGFDSLEGSIGLTVVRGSKLTTTPKNEETERTIAIEALGNMVFQLAAGRYIEGVLDYIGLDISKQQPKNQALALRGSIDGSVATVDLKSASNMTSIQLVRALWPSKWFELFMNLRSEQIQLPNGEWVQLNMMSTMGNGFTFPLMTLTLVALIYGYRCRKRNSPTLWVDWSNTAVFGDDIIVPTHEYDELVDVLQRAGYVVNLDKSYSYGDFRESCGGDFANGYDVTPFYVKRLAHDSDIYVAINQVLDWSACNNAFLPNTLNLLASMLSKKPYFVPEWHSPDQGILTQATKRRYKYLAVEPKYHTLVDEQLYFAVPLAIAGYVNTAEANRQWLTPLKVTKAGKTLIPPSDPSMVFLPRAFSTRYRTRESRLPNGYLDGWDPLTRSQAHSAQVALQIQLTIGSANS